MQTPPCQVRPIACFLPLVFLCLWTLPASAQKRIDVQSKTVTMQVWGEEFLPTLNAVFQQAGVKYRMTSEAEKIVTGIPVRLVVNDVFLREAVDQLIVGNGLASLLTYRIQDGIYQFKPGRLEFSPRVSPAKQKVTLELKAVPLEEALIRLLEQAGANYMFSLEGVRLETVTLPLRKVPFEQALASLLKAAGVPLKLTYKIQDGIVMIYPRQSREEDERPGQNRNVRLHLQAGYLYPALEALFIVLRLKYTLHPTVHTSVMTSVPKKAAIFQVVLDELLKKSGTEWDVRFTEGKWSIMPNKDE